MTLPFIPEIASKQLLLLPILPLKRKNIMLGLLYCPPRDGLSVLSALESTLEELSPAQLESLVILDDFNIELSPSKITSAGSRQVGPMSNKFCLKKIVSSPTRVSKHSCSIIDHIYLLENLVMLDCLLLHPLELSEGKFGYITKLTFSQQITL